MISNAADSSGQWLARAIYAAQQTQTRNHAKNFINKLIKEENYQSIERGDTKVEDYEVHVSLSSYEKSQGQTWILKGQWCC